MATARSSVERTLRAIESRENDVRAWAFIDPVGALASAAVAHGAPAGPLGGAALGVKDLFDTAGPPTEYGSPIFAGRVPATDAAAVAAGMADITLGARTAASVIRPASFCGVVGFKPTFGAVSTDGLRVMAPSLDTAGRFTRDAKTAALVTACLVGGAPTTAEGADEGPTVFGRAAHGTLGGGIA